MNLTAAEKTARNDKSFFGHPRGLAYLSFTEAWERFSFSGMQTLLVLYMVDQLLTPGHIENVLGFAGLRSALESVFGPLASQPLASEIFGLYTSFVFFMPVFGGVLGDRVFGQHRMVMAGAVFMAAGHFLMAFDGSFLIALFFLILGSGCLKGNISTQVSSLYADTDRRRTDAFQIFYAGISLGVVAAPLVCGTLGEVYGWHYGFAAAGIGMVIGLAIYIAGRKYLPPDRRLTARAKNAPILPTDRRMLWVLLLVFVLTGCFLVTNGQLGNVYTLWLKDSVDRRAFGTTIPITWFQALSPVFQVALAPAIVRLWQWQATRKAEPALLPKMGIGLGLGGMLMASLAGLAFLAQSQGGVSWLLVVPMHILVAVSYLYVYPVALALFSRAAPTESRAMFIGIFFLTSFVASNLVGWMGGFYHILSPVDFWLLQASVGFGGAALVVLFGRPLGRVLAANPDG